MNDKYNIISCASYGSSGSSVVTDYLSEYSTIKDLGSYEFRFIQDYMGISTLEDALVKSPHRLNSDIAIQNYLRYVNRQCGNIFNRRYEKFFNNKWKKISLKYIESLVDCSWPGYWEEYQIMETKLKAAIIYQIIPRLKKLFSLRRQYIAHYLPTQEMYFSYPTEEKFLACTRRYIHELCSEIDPSHKYEYIMFDQIMPPANISRYERYFDSIKTIVVDRDPRDYYLENIIRWGEKWVPADLEKFALLYRKQRQQAADFIDSNNVLRIRFEDTIYHYDEFEKSLQSFLNICTADHISIKTRFNPSKSIHNTQLWKKRNIDKNIISRIEELLPEYLYDFESNNLSIG